MLNRQLATSLASIVLSEEEVRKGEISAMEQVKLAAELEQQQARIRTMAQVAPVGMFYIDSNGLMLEANNTWFEITGQPKDHPHTTAFAWMDILPEDSRLIMEVGWQHLTIDRKSWSSELKLKRMVFDPITREHRNRWILASAQPDVAGDGSLRSVLGALTDITEQKASAEHALARAQLSEKMEEEQRRRKEEALERAALSEQLAKRTQEAADSQKIFRRFSDLAPGGLVIMDSKGQITYANDQWFEISGHPHDNSAFATPVSWMKIVHESCMDEFKIKWEALMGPDHIQLNMEILSSKPYESHASETILNNERWILAQAVADVGEDNCIIRIMGCKFLLFRVL